MQTPHISTGLALLLAATGCTLPSPSLDPAADNGTESGASTTQATDPANTTTAAPETTTSDNPTGLTTAMPTDTDTPMDTTGAVCTGVCVAAVPDGWSGPMVRAEVGAQSPLPVCDSSYPETAVSGTVGLSAPPAVCDCSCGSASNVGCGATTLESHGFDSGCGFPDQNANALSSCFSIVGQPGNGYWQVDAPGVSGGSCTASTDESVPALAWTTQVIGCEGAIATQGCGTSELCAPVPSAPYDGQLCVWQEGEQTCPDGYGDQSVYYNAVNDTRSCNACTCSAPTGTCSGTVTLFNGAGCTGVGGGSVPLTGACYQGFGPTAMVSARRNNTTVSASCSASNGRPTGSANPAEAVTVCCADID